MNALKRCIVFLFLLIASLSAWGSANAQADVQYFPETGHYLRGVFLRYYTASKDPLLVYGYPITEQITSRDGKTVQYFHKARFELTSDNTVQLTPLGRLLYSAQNPLTINSTGCRLYPSGYGVCLDFLKFYEANGGPNQFGNPISSFEYAPNGLLVQYFEGARFEWRTNLGANDWIVITDLGRLYFDQQREDPAHLRPAPPPDATIKPILSLDARAFVLKAVTLKSDTQSIYVIVKDQTGQAVSDASVTAAIRLSDGTIQDLTFSTNTAGMGQASFNFSDQRPGDLLTVSVTVSYQGVSTTTSTSFRVWF